MAFEPCIVSYPWSKAAVEAFVGRFERCEVGKHDWTHQAHLVTGFWYVFHLGADQALGKMRLGIRRHNEAVGTPNTDTGGYHETITRLYLSHMEPYAHREPAGGFDACLAEVLASPMSHSGWPLTLYTRERLFSAEARRTWLEPDLPVL